MGVFDPDKPKAEFQSFIDSLSDEIEFWDYSRFDKELQAAELPELPISLLDNARLTWLLRDTNPADETGIWDVLDRAAREDDWQWPESSDAVKDKLEDLLRSE